MTSTTALVPRPNDVKYTGYLNAFSCVCSINCQFEQVPAADAMVNFLEPNPGTLILDTVTIGDEG